LVAWYQAPSGSQIFSADRGDVDNLAGLLRAHHRQNQLAEPRQPEHIDLELPPPFVERHVFQRAVGAVAGIVDQDVDASRLVLDRVHRGDDRNIVRQVELEQSGAGGGEAGHAVEASGARENTIAGGKERAGRGFADPGGCAGHKSCLSICAVPTADPHPQRHAL
jgi:hypothetical protein